MSTTTIITISNIAGGDRRRFRATLDAHGTVTDVSDAAIRHAQAQGAMGYTCDRTDAADIIDQAIEDYDAYEE